jgi:hypothetical protein
MQLPPDFSAFLRLLAEHGVDYLVVGGYAVSFHGYPRTTGDLDVWVRRTPDNAHRLVRALRAFGFDVPELTPALFLEPERIVRMGHPPLRIEVLTTIDGVEFEACYPARRTVTLDGVPVSLIGLDALKRNKRASGRTKDRNDLENLP